MKGYPVAFGYMGYIPKLGRFVLFSTEAEYEEIYKEYEMEDFT